MFFYSIKITYKLKQSLLKKILNFNIRNNVHCEKKDKKTGFHMYEQFSDHFLMQNVFDNWHQVLTDYVMLILFLPNFRALHDFPPPKLLLSIRQLIFSLFQVLNFANQKRRNPIDELLQAVRSLVRYVKQF